MQVDPVAAKRIEPKDVARIARALEVFEATGRPLSDWHGDPQPPLLAKGTWEGVALMPERSELYVRIEARFDAMMDAGGTSMGQTRSQRMTFPAAATLRSSLCVGVACWADRFSSTMPCSKTILS